MGTEQRFVLSFDPGETNIGYARFETNFKKKGDGGIHNLKDMGITSPKGFFGLLTALETSTEVLGHKISHVVAENYRVRNDPGNKRGSSGDLYGWSEVKTIRVIGQLEYFAHRVGAEMVYSEPGMLAQARLWCDLPGMPKKGHPPDDLSAYVHGVKFFKDMGLVRGPQGITKFAQGDLFAGAEFDVKDRSEKQGNVT